MPEPSRRSRRAVLGGFAALSLGGQLPGASATTVSALMPPERSPVWPGARLRGQGEFRHWGVALYQAQLWVAEGFEPREWATSSLGLVLSYRRHLSAAAIARRSLEEMEAQGPLEPTIARRWEGLLRRLLPDVAPGDMLGGRHQPQAGAWFADGRGRVLGEVADPVFSRRFFGIWLDERSRAPELRSALLGVAPSEVSR